jgi:hypothetical protein
MKNFVFCVSVIIAGLSFVTSCKQHSTDATYVSVRKIVPSHPITGDTLCGSLNGTLLTSTKTYYMTCPVNINAGDTLTIQSGVTINVVSPNAYIYVDGAFISLGTQDAPNWITVPGLPHQNTVAVGQNSGSDSAFIAQALWHGILCDTGCGLCLMKWTHLEFVGGYFGATAPIASFGANHNAWPIYFSNPNGFCIFEDSWMYGTIDDFVRFAGGKICFMRNTFEKSVGTGGDGLNAKQGTVGIMAYNMFIGSSVNSTKASNKGSSTTDPPCQIDMYNNTYVNGGRVAPSGKGSDINYEQGASGQCYNNLIVNCRYGYRIVGNPAADTAHCYYGYNYQYGDSLSVVDQFYPISPSITNPQPTDIPSPNYLPAGYTPGSSYNAPQLVQANDPMFVNYPLPCPSGFAIDYVSGFDFHLQTGSPAIGKGHVNFTPLAVPGLVVDPNFGPSEITPPGPDMGCYQSDGVTGNHH